MNRRVAGLMLSCATLLYIGTAHAVTPVVLYSGSSTHLSHASTVFKVDQASGKAWVNLFVPQGFHTEEVYERNLSVNGLRYDSTRQQIVYQPNAETQVVCATTASSGQGWFKRTRITPTGQCPIVTQRLEGSTRINRANDPVQLVFVPTVASGHAQ